MSKKLAKKPQKNETSPGVANAISSLLKPLTLRGNLSLLSHSLPKLVACSDLEEVNWYRGEKMSFLTCHKVLG